MADRDQADPIPPRRPADPWGTRPRTNGIPRDEVYHERFPWLPSEPRQEPEPSRDSAPVPAPEPAAVPVRPTNGTVIPLVVEPVESRPPRGEQVFIDVWDDAERAAAPVVAARKRRSTLLITRELVETLILALLIFIAVRGVVQNFRVEGSSMDPTYHTGQYVLVNKALYTRVNLQALGRFLPFIGSDDTGHYLFRGPKRGEVIVFHPPRPNDYERDFIKRVIGLPGDHVQVKDGRVIVNGRELREPYLRNVQTFCGGQWCDVTLQPSEYFVMGDNRTNSSDSRLWGPVPAENIIGKSWLIYLPFDDFGPAPNQSPGIGDLPADAAARPRSP